MKRTAEERRAFVERAAAHMAATPTPAEEAMWEILKPLGFERQFWIAGTTKNGLGWHYIMDFFHFTLKLCVEVDGGVHARTKGRDRRRDARLAGEGIRTIRYTNKQVLKYAALVRTDVKIQIGEIERWRRMEA